VLAEHQTRGAQLLYPFLIALPCATPVITLQEHKGPLKVKPVDGKHIAAKPP
jgi:hypothetical protein